MDHNQHPYVVQHTNRRQKKRKRHSPKDHLASLTERMKIEKKYAKMNKPITLSPKAQKIFNKLAKIEHQPDYKITEKALAMSQRGGNKMRHRLRGYLREGEGIIYGLRRPIITARLNGKMRRGRVMIGNHKYKFKARLGGKVYYFNAPRSSGRVKLYRGEKTRRRPRRRRHRRRRTRRRRQRR